MFLPRRRRICFAGTGILTVTVGLLILFYEPNTYSHRVLPTSGPSHNGIFFIEHSFKQPHEAYRIKFNIISKNKSYDSFVVPVTAKKIRNSSMMAEILSSYSNIQMVNLNVSKAFTDTPLHDWYKKKQWTRSYWPSSHFSDALRWLCLLQFGGTYMDMDVVVMRPLPDAPNYLGLESHLWASAGVVRFTRGHPLALAFVEQMAQHFDPLEWGANGPKLITKVLQDKCGLKLPSGATPGCMDVTVLPPKAFYPIPWWDWKLYVTENVSLSQKLVEDKEVFALHVWNHLSSYSTIHLHSRQPYATAATRNCPITVAAVGDSF
ncbi:unnamed protein product, partial [Meganyctiphanes norvegica]